MLEKGRWVLLEHMGSPDDPFGLHFDFLLEDTLTCITWRFVEVPSPEGPPVQVTPLSPHRLEWLDIKHKVLTRNRGEVNRIENGTFVLYANSIKPNYCVIGLGGTGLVGELVITNEFCTLTSIKK